jgi:hypothetical protein
MKSTELQAVKYVAANALFQVWIQYILLASWRFFGFTFFLFTFSW